MDLSEKHKPLKLLGGKYEKSSKSAEQKSLRLDTKSMI